MAPSRDDSQLAVAARDGDASSYEELFERYQGKIYNYVYGICGNTEDAKDITQDAFIKVFEALGRIEGDLNFSAYLYRTAHNLTIDQIKAAGKFASPEALDFQLESSLYADPERAALLGEQQAQVRQAAFTLSEDFRAVLALRELQDLSYEEIASVLEMPKNTVGVLLSRARLKFKGAFRMSQVDVDKLSKECEKMLPLLSAFIDNELDVDERQKVEEHLDDCPLCRLALEEMTEASKSYRALIPLLPVAAIRSNVMPRIAELSRAPTGSVPSTSTPAEPSGSGGPSGTGAQSSSSGPKAKRWARKGARSAARRGLTQAIKELPAAYKALAALIGIIVLVGAAVGVPLGLSAVGLLRGIKKPPAIEKLSEAAFQRQALPVLPTIEATPLPEEQAAAEEEEGGEPSSGTSGPSVEPSPTSPPGGGTSGGGSEGTGTPDGGTSPDY